MARLAAILLLASLGASLGADLLPKSFWERATLTGDWGGGRARLEERGVTLGLRYDGEFWANLRGGLKRGVAFDGLVTLDLDVDLAKLVGWSGATLHATGLNPQGVGPTQKLVGDRSTVSNIDFYDSARLYTLWLDQEFIDGKASLRAGMLAVDEEFAVSDYALLFINSSFGVPSAQSAGLPIPVYAISAPGVRLKVQPVEWAYLQVAAYDGNPAPGVLADPSPDAAPSNEYNRSGTQWALRPDEGAFLIAEIGVQVNPAPEDAAADRMNAVPRGLAGRYKVGFARHTDTFSNSYDATLIELGSSLAPTPARGVQGNSVFYFLADQELWREPDTVAQGLGAFVRGTFAPPGRNAVSHSIDAGLHYAGLLPGRDEDQAGLGFSWRQVSGDVARAVRATNRADRTDYAVPDHEAVLEFTYAIRATPWCTLQPDVQWIIHPGGSGALGNAFVIGLRTTILF